MRGDRHGPYVWFNGRGISRGVPVYGELETWLWVALSRRHESTCRDVHLQPWVTIVPALLWPSDAMGEAGYGVQDPFAGHLERAHQGHGGEDGCVAGPWVFRIPTPDPR